MTKFLNISTDTTLGGSSASDSTVSSQKAIKAYVDSQTGTAPTFANITGQPTDNTNLASALNAKYDASNPNGYTSNVGTVTSVNNVNPVNGNVTLSIPTVNNATLTIQKNGTTVKTFTANASTDVTANITVPTKVSDLTNDSGFITGITSSDVTTALGYTPYNSSNPSGYQANVIETVKVNGTALTPSSKAVDITVPAAQVNSDWNASSGVAQILNKPSLATVATSGSYNDLSNKPTIPTVNNATLTITQGGVSKGTFTANASSNVTIALDSGGSVDVDNKSITTNSSDEIQTVGVINSRDSSTAIKTWTGTKAQYDAITTKDSATLYNITDDTDVTLTILEALYPVGSVYITTANTCPLSTLISSSTWTLVSSGIVKAGDIPCKGNGKTLGLTGNGALFQQNNAGLTSISGYVNSNAGTSVSGATWNNANLTVGVTTDSSKSGIIADTSSLTLAVNIYERTV